MSDALFQALFSYRPVVFNEGEFRFDLGVSSLVAAVLVAAAVGIAIVTYRRVRVNDGRPRDRIVLATRSTRTSSRHSPSCRRRAAPRSASTGW
jgi:hypothetical protein